MTGPLEGLRVLDLTRVMAGPWCTQILADLGAEVIKIERPVLGDDTRHWGPPWLKDGAGNDTSESAYYLSTNRGKHSVAVDIASDAGKQIIRDLAAKSDFFIENFKVGGLARLGLGYDDIRAVNPEIIYLSLTGFGQTGPMASQPGYDYLVQARGGLMSVTGPADGEPQRSGLAVGDLTTGMYATIGLLSALQHRHRTGQGQYIDLALLDTQVGWLANQAMNYFVSGNVPRRTGKWHANLVPYQPFDASDRPVIIAVGNDGQFAKLCQFIGRPELIVDARFATNPVRIANRVALETELAAEIIKHDSEYWLEHLPKQGVPACPINDIEQAFQEPQVQHRGMKIDLPHPLAGSVPGVANPLKFSETPVSYEKAPPLLGEDTDAVLSRMLDMSDEQLCELRKKGVLQ